MDPTTRTLNAKVPFSLRVGSITFIARVRAVRPPGLLFQCGASLRQQIAGVVHRRKELGGVM